MGATFNTGYLENLILYNGSNNIGIGTSADATYKVTLGGSLLGTSATFSGKITSNQTADLIIEATNGGTNRLYNLISNTSGGLYTGVEGSTAGSLLTGSAAYDGVIFTNANSNLVFGTNFTKRLSIDKSTGAATFSSSVQAGSFKIVNVSTAEYGINTENNQGYIGTTTSHGFNIMTNNTPRLTFHATTGAATFSSSVTVTSDLTVDTNTLYVDSTNNRVGIGTTTFLDTTYKLSIKQGTNRNIAIAEQSSELSIEAYNDAGSANVPLRLYASEFNMLGGSVGIGTASPSSILHIQGVSGSTKFTLQPPSGQPNIIEFLTNAGVVDARIKNESTQLQFETGTSGTPKMVITSGGNVLLGTTDNTAAYRLNVAVNGGSAYMGVTNQAGGSGDRYLRIGFGTGATVASIQGTRVNVADDVNLALQPDGGRVGIGTTSPSDKLTVTDASTYTFNIGAASGGAGAVLYTLGSAALTFATNGSANERMRITSSGNLLFNGTSNPGGIGNIYIGNSGSLPGTPSGGGVLYVEGGALKFKGSSGTITTIANA